jgi:hypothetical protein
MSLAVVRDTSPSRHRPRDVLQVIQNLRRQNPRVGESRLAQLLADQLYDDRDLLVDAAGHLVRKALVTAKPKSIAKVTAARRQRVARQEAEKQTVRQVAEKIRAVVLLDLTMPNGVAMRYCTGTQLAAFGSAYEKIAERAGAAMVGEVMVEAEVRTLLQVGV